MMNLGTTIEFIHNAEKQLGSTFPEKYKELLLLSNGIECPPDWEIYSVFDSTNPRKSSRNEIVSPNTNARWEYMDKNLLCIASNGFGNRLVVNMFESADIIYIWNHETNKLKKWSKDFDYLIVIAKKRIEKIEKLIKKSKGI
jgi:hypothetical protein